MTVLLVVLAVLLAGAYVVWTAGRLDRMHARVDAAWAALDAQLVRRAFAAGAVAEHLPPTPQRAELQAAAARAAAAGEAGRCPLEDHLSSLLQHARAGASGGDRAELTAATERVLLARAFHDSAVRDTLRLRRRRVPRLLRLAGHRAAPAPFTLDESLLAPADTPPDAPGARSRGN